MPLRALANLSNSQKYRVLLDVKRLKYLFLEIFYANKVNFA